MAPGEEPGVWLRTNWQRVAELCYIKCRCSNTNDDEDIIDESQVPPTEFGLRPFYKWPEAQLIAAESLVYEWDFDLSRGFQRPRNGEEEVWGKWADTSNVHGANAPGPTQGQYCMIHSSRCV
jgi:hypothetical protein